jgi:hypothetical protein
MSTKKRQVIEPEELTLFKVGFYNFNRPSNYILPDLAKIIVHLTNRIEMLEKREK